LLASRNEADRAEGQRLSDNPPPELIAEAERMHDAIPESERPRHDAHLSIYGAVDSKKELYFRRSVHAGLAGVEQVWQNHYGACRGDKAGDEKSSRRLAIVMKDYQDRRYGWLDPNRLPPSSTITIFRPCECVWTWGSEALTQEELADCFDESLYLWWNP